MRQIKPADHEVLLRDFEPGIDISVGENGRLEICANTPNGHVLNSVAFHPDLAFALRNFLNDHLIGD